MPIVEELLSGLTGVTGCDFRLTQNQLVFVESGGTLSALNLACPMHTVLGAGFTQPQDVKVSRDGDHAYVDERSGALLRVDLGNPNRAAATVVGSGLDDPRQMALDEAHEAAYVVEYAVTGHLYRIDLVSGRKTPILSSLNFPVGLVLSADLQYAYISEETAGPGLGRVSRFRLSDGGRQALVAGLAAPGFLAWADAAQTALLVPERDAANRISRIEVASGAIHVLAGDLPAKPTSIAMVNPGTLLICSHQAIARIDLLPFQQTCSLLMGIGFIPVDEITEDGLADTTLDPSNPFQVNQVPFAGTLPLMVNHRLADRDGFLWYRIRVDGQVRTDSWTDLKWNGSHYMRETIAPAVIDGQSGCYPVHPVSEQHLWLNPWLGSRLDSTSLANGTHRIQLEFLHADGRVRLTAEIALRVDNLPCSAALKAPAIGTTRADTCGLLRYQSPGDLVAMGLMASHPNHFATFSFTLFKCLTPLTPPSVRGPVGSAPGLIQGTATALLGRSLASPGVGAFAEYLNVAATATNGWNRQSQYDAAATQAFTLAPGAGSEGTIP